MFLCPICAKELSKCESTLKCASNHSFDYSKSGYVNLLNPGKMNNAKAGDSKEMIRARTEFFESGAYSKIRDMLCTLVSSLKNNIVVDAGCGEGYYTYGLAKAMPDSYVIGFDMSKFGCEHASKVAKREGLFNLSYAVSNIFSMPLASEYADIVVSLFAPVASEEFYRILRNGGHLIVASAGIKHLDGLKMALYDDVYPNEEKFPIYEGLELLRVENLKYSTTISGNGTIKALFTMTPYYHRTSLSDKEKLNSVSEISTTIEVNFAIYKKQNF
ncbi:MAG: methyltransferase domain-containing protein [Clostridia bacterium]|nr:methyltransferase domain-containing protein [Clostridia bacterium]MBR2944484.1 methyltransferase domain-containing protein [Clostridia bacterium]